MRKLNRKLYKYHTVTISSYYELYKKNYILLLTKKLLLKKEKGIKQWIQKHCTVWTPFSKTYCIPSESVEIKMKKKSSWLVASLQKNVEKRKYSLRRKKYCDEGEEFLLDFFFGHIFRNFKVIEFLFIRIFLFFYLHV